MSEDYSGIANYFDISEKAASVIIKSGLERRFNGNFDGWDQMGIYKLVHNLPAHGTERIAYIDVTHEVLSIIRNLEKE